MCEPVTIMAAMAVATTAMSTVAQVQQASAQKKVIDQQSEIRAQQIQQQAGQQESVAAMRARQERAASIAAASSAGVNLGSNSFMASLQTTTMNQANENGLILENEQNQQQANTAETQSLLNSKASSPTFMGATLNMALAGADAYMSGKAQYDLGANKPTPNAG
jgi:hypothetical protein